MKKLIVSTGSNLRFQAGDSVFNGCVVSSREVYGTYAEISVEVEHSIKPGAQLSLPGCRGGCGLAKPRNQHGRTLLEIWLPYDLVELTTIGK